MPFKVVLVDKDTLISHGNWNEPLQKLLQGLSCHDVTVMDISDEKCFWETGLIPENCLFIADCETTVQLARKLRVAVLGYQPPKTSGLKDEIRSHLDIMAEGFEETDYTFLLQVYQRFHHLPWTVMETERCVLREMMPEDLDALYELYTPEKMTDYIEGLQEDREKEKEFIKAYIETMYPFYGYGLWMVIEKETGKIIGRAGLAHLETEEEIQLELGYMIALEKQNQGYATEVCQKIIDYVQKKLEFPSICCLIQKENTVSIHLAQKLGFQYAESIIMQEKELQKYVRTFLYFTSQSS